MTFSDLESMAEARRLALQGYEAWQKFRSFQPEQIDAIVQAMAKAAEREAGRLAELAHVETGYGNVEDKRLKNLFLSRYVGDWLANIRTLGVLWRDETTKVMAIGEPMGVVAALIPVTHPTGLVMFKVLSAVKAGNAIVCAPHPRGAKSSYETARVMAEAAVQAGAPPNLVQCMKYASIEGTGELMKHYRTAVVLATGGAAMVRAAYSSGKPTLAVGPGNVPCYVDRSKSKDLADVADTILSSKNFDYGTGCPCEQSIIADRPIANMLRAAIRDAGGYFCSPSEADALAKVMFYPNLGFIVDNVAQPAAKLAQLAGFSVPPNTRILLAEQTGVGRNYPWSAEKLAPAIAFYEVADAEAGYDVCNQILRFGGEGHSAVLHTNDTDQVVRFSSLQAGRIFVNTSSMFAAVGFSADLEPSFMLGTGTLAGSITSDNVTAMHMINVKRVAYESRPWRSMSDMFERTT